MRGTLAGLFTFVLVGLPLAAQVGPPPKPPATPPLATPRGDAPKPGATPPVRKVKTDKLISFSSFEPGSVRDVWIALDDDDRIEIKDIKVRTFFENIQAIGAFGTIVIKDSIKEEKMPETILTRRNFGDFINTLGQISDDFEMKLIEGSAEVFVVSAKPKSPAKSNVLFLPVNLEPLVAPRIGKPKDAREADEMERMKIKVMESTRIIVEQGIAFDAEARGLKPTMPLKMMVHPGANILFLAGQSEQVEVAAKILAALGAHIPPQEMLGGTGSGWRTAPGGSGMGSPGMSMGFGGMGEGGMIPGMSGQMMGGPGMGMPGQGSGGPVGGGVLGDPMSGAGVPHAPKPKPGTAIPGGGSGSLGSGNFPIKP